MIDIVPTLVPVVLLWLLCAYVCDWIGERKGYPGGRSRFVAMGALFGLLGVAIAAVMPAHKARVENLSVPTLHGPSTHGTAG